MRLRAEYHRASDFVRDHDQQFLRGGLLLRVEPSVPLNLFESVELELVAPDGQSWVTGAQVVQVIAGTGVAVAFALKDLPELAAAVELARSASDESDAPSTHSCVDPQAEAVTRAAARPTAPPGGLSAAKIHLALHGSKDERAAMLRDKNPTLHQYVLRNPQIQHDEVLTIARSSAAGPELLKAIAERREWAQRPDVAVALVRNPKVPPPIAVKLLDFVGLADLRQIAKDPGTREAIKKVARKKVVG
jgi:hypothetical protein